MGLTEYNSLQVSPADLLKVNWAEAQELPGPSQVAMEPIRERGHKESICQRLSKLLRYDESTEGSNEAVDQLLGLEKSATENVKIVNMVTELT